MMLDNIRVIAVAPNRTLTIASSLGSGVSVELSPADLNANAGGFTNFTRTYGDGTTLNLSAPIFSGTDGFVKWLKNGVDLSTSPNVNVIVNADMALTAVYVTGTSPWPMTMPIRRPSTRPSTVAASGVLANDFDLNGNPLTAVLDTPAGHGTVTLNSDGGFVYTPDHRLYRTRLVHLSCQ